MARTIKLNIDASSPTLKDMLLNLKAIKDTTKDINDGNQLNTLTQETNSLNEAIKAVNESTTSTVDTFEELGDESQSITQQIGELEDKLFKMAVAGEQNTEEFKKLSKEAGTMKGKILEVNQSVDDIANNRGLATFGDSIANIGASLLTLDFERAEGQATALAKSAGNIKFGDAIKSAKSLGKTLLSLGKAILANPLFLIAAIVIAIGAAIYKLLDELGLIKVAMEIVGKAIDTVIQAFKDLLDWMGLTSYAAEDAADRQAEAAKRAADATERENNKQISSIDHKIRRYAAEGKAVTELEREKVVLLAQTAKARLEEGIAAAKAAQLKGDLDEEEANKLAENLRTLKETYRLSREEIKTFDIETNAKKNAEIADADEKAAAIAEQKAKDAAARRAEIRQNDIDIARQIKDFELGLIEDTIQKELAMNTEKYERLREDTLANTKLTLEQKNDLIELYNNQEIEDAKQTAQTIADNKLAILQEQFNREDEQYALLQELRATDEENEIAKIVSDYEKKYELALGNAELEKELAIQQQEELNAINAKYRAAEEAAEEESRLKRLARADEKLDIARTYASSVNNLTQGVFAITNSLGAQDEKSKEARAKKQFKVQKALQLSLATIDGFKAVTTSLAQSPIAIGPVPNPAGIASLAFAVGTSVANIAKIASSRYEGGGGQPSAPNATGAISSTSSSLASADSATPSIGFFGGGNDGNNVGSTDDVEGGQPMNIQVTASISETEVTERQNFARRINNSGSISL